MKNRNNSLLNKKFPAFLGILFFVGSVGILGWLSTNTILFGTKAAVGSTPKNIQVTNITDTSFTVTYMTDSPLVGTLAYGNDAKMAQVAFDDRDSATGKPQQYTVHQITAKQLTPATQYYFAIGSGEITSLNNGQPFQVTTASSSAQTSNQTPLTGKVTLSDGTIPKEGIVFANSDTSQVLSGLLAPDGSYSIPLTNVRTPDLTNFASISATTVFHLIVSNGSQQSTASLLGNQTNPVPLIVLGNDYDFTINNSPISPTGSASTSANAGFSTPVDTSQVSSPEILVPQPQEKLQDQQPMFSGKAVPNASVQITIESSSQIQTTIQADNYGNWQFRPPVPLGAGLHTITILSQDASGVMQTVTQSFTVYASGSQFTVPSVSPSPTATPSATPVVLPTPTVTATPSATPTFTPTPQLSPTISAILTAPPTQPIAKTGSSSVEIGIVGSFAAIGIGTFIFLFTIL